MFRVTVTLVTTPGKPLVVSVDVVVARSGNGRGTLVELNVVGPAMPAQIVRIVRRDNLQTQQPGTTLAVMASCYCSGRESLPLIDSLGGPDGVVRISQTPRPYVPAAKMPSVGANSRSRTMTFGRPVPNRHQCGEPDVKLTLRRRRIVADIENVVR